MKNLKIVLGMVLLIISLQACQTQKDCRGNTKHKHPNGFYM